MATTASITGARMLTSHTDVSLRALQRVSRQWTTLGKEDPLWAILSRPDKKGRRWDHHTFFQTGALEVERIIRTAEGLRPLRFQRALDFGCGVGRLTQALATRFNTVVGVDVSDSMIQMALRLNQYPRKCEYLHNLAPDLGLLADRSFDLVYSSKTLQHLTPSLARRYIQDFFRIARPNAHVVFQIPSRPRSVAWSFAKRIVPVQVTNLLWRFRTGSPEAMESYFMSEENVTRLVEDSGGSVAYIESNEEGPPGWKSCTYFCRTAIT